MGLFDELKKISKGDIEKFGKEFVNNVQNVTNDIGANISKEIKNATGVDVTQSGEAKKSNVKEIPAEYSEFPTFSKDPDDLETKETDKYKRCSMNFYNVSNEEIESYTSKIQSLGYTKNTKVRFDKGNTYIIVDTDTSYDLNLVFHIKK